MTEPSVEALHDVIDNSEIEKSLSGDRLFVPLPDGTILQVWEDNTWGWGVFNPATDEMISYGDWKDVTTQHELFWAVVRLLENLNPGNW